MNYQEFISEINSDVDEDTTIIMTKGVHINNYIALHQKWKFDGLIAESLIFKTSQVQSLDKLQLISLVKQELPELIFTESEITYSTNELHTFLNFNFRY